MERLLFWAAVIVFAIASGFLAVRLYDSYMRVEPEVPAPIRIFRTPNDRDYSWTPVPDFVRAS